MVEKEGNVVEGVLHCSHFDCRHEYPILDSVPLLVEDLRGYVQVNIGELLRRRDLSETTHSLLGDCLGPGTPFDVVRQQLSSYTWDHYGQHDPTEAMKSPEPGSLFAVWQEGMRLCGKVPLGPVLDLGCGVGGVACHIAEASGQQVLGIDFNFPMIRLAAQVAREQRVSYPLRRTGVVYDRREFALPLANAENLDFWACDAGALPLEDGMFSLVVALNILDATPAPLGLLQEIARMLRPGGKAIIATPFDWSPAATAVEQWIGGHSQRGDDQGQGAPLLRKLLTPGGHPSTITGLRILGEHDDLTWRVRMHDRSFVQYREYLVAVEKLAD